MTALRTTRRALLALPLVLAGCGAPTAPTAGPPPSSGVGTGDPAWVALRGQLPAPDPDRIGYDERTRTLALYDLPGNDRWMVRAGAEGARPAAPQHRLPADADPEQVIVYYVRPGMKPSAPVSVKQIRDLGRAHSSLAILK